MTMLSRQFFTICLLVGLSSSVFGQEGVAPVDRNPWLESAGPKPALKTTALSLPFFEDFSGEGLFPDPARWVDRSVYVNNTMGFKPISRGVATFDALNANGGPYDSVNNNALLFADSLTSQPIDLSVHSPADSIYLSFFYQPQGNGFAPEVQDSLYLFFRRSNNSWARVWETPGATLHEFKQAMVAVTDPLFFHSDFQFRFVNKASMNINDDVWNVDYIRMDVNRGVGDTTVNDVATSTQPSFLLNDYTSMPYRQFAANMNNELSGQHYFYVKNNYSGQRTVDYGYRAREVLSNTSLFTGTSNTDNVGAYEERQFQFPMYSVGFTAPGPYSRVIFEQEYYATPQGGLTEPRENDTVRMRQEFDYYLAYDDGTAEKSYFLNQFTTLPAKTAIEFHLNEPDTIRGVAIYFGRQVPLATNKFFSVGVYKDIAVNGGTEHLVYQQDLLFPSYADTINKFWYYRFDTPVYMDAGTFFMGTIQPAASGSDSLYLGLDVNRIGGNHLYFDVNGFWEPSIISGAVMLRPVLGEFRYGTGVEDVKEGIRWTVGPNPVRERLQIDVEGKARPKLSYRIFDLQGRTLDRGVLSPGAGVNVSDLSPGIYFVQVIQDGVATTPEKIIKL